MQLSHLIPHLDAEISRLERVRGLLSLHLEFLSTHPGIDPKTLSAVAAPEAPALTLQASSAPADPNAQPAITRVKQRRSYTRNQDARYDRRKRVIALDTALRGPVPSGPVVVSAEEARKSQAAKAAQFVRAEEVKRAGTDLAPAFQWRSQGSSVRHADALLQRLMNIGEAMTESNRLGQLPAPNSHDAEHAPLAKVD